jgi:cysteine desulfurase
MNATHPGLVDGPIYLDYNATTPVDPRVVEAALPWFSHHFGNPSSAHAYGELPRQAVAGARAEMAGLLGCTPEEVVFTGGGSEADNLAIRGVVLAARARGDHVVTQATEHPAVLATCRALERLQDVRVTYLPVDGYGRVSPADLDAAMTRRTVLVSIMHANNETGTVQPIADLARIAHRHGALFHTDAAQSVGKISARVDELGVDLLTVAGHKLYAPKGVGALYVRAGVELEPVIYGGGQERGLRAGTESVALAVALGAAARIAGEDLEAGAGRLRRLRDLLEARLGELLTGRTRLNGHQTERLPNTLNIAIEGVRGDDLLAVVSLVAASTGSACHAGGHDPSPVLLAMGLPADRALSALRLSLGRLTSEAEVEEAAVRLAECAQRFTAGSTIGKGPPAQGNYERAFVRRAGPQGDTDRHPRRRAISGS